MTFNKETTPNYLNRSIILTILPCLLFGRVAAIFCLPFGIVAIVHAAQVKTQLELADDQGAIEASKKAKKWFWFGFVSVLITTVLFLFYLFDYYYYYFW